MVNYLKYKMVIFGHNNACEQINDLCCKLLCREHGEVGYLMLSSLITIPFLSFSHNPPFFIYLVNNHLVYHNKVFR